MPNYTLQCDENPEHKKEVRLSFDDFDRIKRIGWAECWYTEHWEKHAVPFPRMRPVIYSSPVVFALNDGDFRYSMKYFDIGQNRTEI